MGGWLGAVKLVNHKQTIPVKEDVRPFLGIVLGAVFGTSALLSLVKLDGLISVAAAFCFIVLSVVWAAFAVYTAMDADHDSHAIRFISNKG